MRIKYHIACFFIKYVYRWKFIGQFPNDLKKFVLIGGPHTSNHDFFIGLFTKWYFGANFHFVGKKSLFTFPLGIFLKALGGVPIDRSKSQGFVDAVVGVFNQKKQFVLAISPEGTRKQVARWKTGFYHIAKMANVPVVTMTFDFGNRQTEFFEPFYPTEDKDADINYLKSLIIGVDGKNPEGNFKGE